MIKHTWDFSHPAWILQGVIWGTFMYLIMEIAMPLFQSEPYVTRKLIFGAVIWLAGGFIWAFIMHLSMRQTGNGNGKPS